MPLKSFSFRIPERFKNRSRILLLILVMTGAILIVGGVTIMSLFVTTSEGNKRLMRSYAETQASLIEAVAQRTSEQGIGAAPSLAVQEHIRFTIEQIPAITETAELLFAYKDGGDMHFLEEFRFANSQTSQTYAMSEPAFEPMRRALVDKTAGHMIVEDYRGHRVLAAYSPVEGMNLGVVAKIDLNEIRTPFVVTGISAGVATFILVGVGVVLFRRIGNPLVQSLEENEMKYRTLFESANEGVLVLGDYIEECNDQVTHLLGYEKHEIIGSTIDDFTPQPQLEGLKSAEVAKNRLELARRGVPQYFVWQSLRKDGTLVDIDVMLKAVRVGDRRFVLATLLDITDRRRAEIELRRAEKEVSEAREHLAHVARLSTMGEMAAGIAHEINQPLAAISTYAQACKRMLQQPSIAATEFAEPLDRIGTQAMRAGEVIRRLRSFVNKSDSGMELLQCNQLVREVVKLSDVDARKYDIPVELDLQERLPPLRVDPVQIQQVILNLIRNALEAMEDTPRDYAKVMVKTALSANGQVEIKVSDKGSGLSEEALMHVFTPFFTTKRSGMGMGLSISHSIVLAHGGALNVYNNTSIGATFVVVLPPAVENQMALGG